MRALLYRPVFSIKQTTPLFRGCVPLAQFHSSSLAPSMLRQKLWTSTKVPVNLLHKRYVAATSSTSCNASAENAFSSNDPETNLKAQLIADGKADTPHFMLDSHRPIDSSISKAVQTSPSDDPEVALYTNEAQHALPHPIWSTEAADAVRYVTSFSNIYTTLIYTFVSLLLD